MAARINENCAPATRPLGHGHVASRKEAPGTRDLETCRAVRRDQPSETELDRRCAFDTEGPRALIAQFDAAAGYR